MTTFDSTATDYALESIGGGIVGRGWTLQPARCALLVHDLLPYYVDTLAPNVRASVLTQVHTAIAWAQALDVPVLCSAPRAARTLSERGLGGELWGLGPTAGEAADASLIGIVEARWVLKRSYSAFAGTDLAIELRRTERNQLLIAGVFASAGIVATAFDALANDVQAFVLADATADHSPDRHRMALEYVTSTMADVISVAALPHS
ncbi:isochorismatase family protein [Curtobacterium ammoniigenes]|uniref:isochorismatase family protein n=1 Tax=Curtobacterium ammoniigenes TaxID=395387 RepID=UPI00082A88B6|nr:isochorismatase family protein [Curtobacterium ammoniigenes]